MRYQLACASFVVLISLGMPAARACAFLVPPSPIATETTQAYAGRVEEYLNVAERKREANAVRTADTILIARITRLETSDGQAPSNTLGLEPVDWLKGERPPGAFSLTSRMTECGPSGAGDAARGQVGGLFVIFARKGPLGSGTLIDAIAVDHVIDPGLAKFVTTYRAAPTIGKPSGN